MLYLQTEEIFVNFLDVVELQKFQCITPTFIKHMIKEANRYTSQFLETPCNTMKQNLAVRTPMI